MKRRRYWLLGLACCAVLHFASVRTWRITPALAEFPVATTGSFQPEGHYPGEPFRGAVGVRSWGSWSGGDQNLGTIALGPFPAPRMLRFGIGGYPDNPGNSLRVELAGTPLCQDLHPGAVGERWHVVDVELPPAWRGRPIRIVAEDASKRLGGWLAVTEPIRGGRSDGNHALIQSLASFALHGLLLGAMFFAAFDWLARRGSLAAPWLPLGAAAVVAIAGYAAFWVYFANALLGVIFSWLLLLIAIASVVRAKEPIERETAGECGTVVKLMLAIGAFYLGLLHLFPTQHDFYTLAANRYREAMPTDNVIPHGLAERLFASEPPKNPADEWQSSDRPPLQAGWLLITWPVTKTLSLDRRTGSGAAAVWFQLLWIPAAFALLRTFGVERRRAAGWIAALGLCGFFVQNTTYTWPKLSAAAFACGAFAVLLMPSPGIPARRNALWSAAFAGLAWLSHGGVAFAYLALLPLLIWRAASGAWRDWLPGGAVFLALVLPWVAYQQFYDPPGNQLFKLHLAGQQQKDLRGTLQTIRENYAALGWQEAWANKVSNFHGQVFGEWKHLIDFSGETAVARRAQEFFHTGRALTWWPVAALLAVLVTRRRWFVPGRDLMLFGGWLLATIVIWCLLMFGRYQAVIHHGSYTVMIGLFVFFSVMLERCGRGWLPMVAGLQAITLGTTWAIGNPSIHGPAAGLGFVLITGLALAWFVARAGHSSEQNVAVEAHATSPQFQGASAFAAWWRNPTLNLWVLAALALLLLLRKPDALFNPQLWAEDGSIFLVQADLHGVSALAKPYMGYLHTLPRLIAWLAPRLLDPRWWPAFYNGVSFVIWLAVLARLFTSRFDLPGKPWLALALIFTPHSGEVFFNVTNLQWLTAFVLLQQVLIRAPRNTSERVSDLVILALVTLTGPFGIVFLPLFAWRWWRDRRRDNAFALSVVFAGAIVQAWLVIRTGPRFDFQSAPLQLWANVVVLARRLVLWPVLGRDAALAMSPAMVGSLGGAFIVALLVFALRRDPRRTLRAVTVAAFALITAAAVYRTRPDTWAGDNLHFGDRYFYIPRVLLAWLLIWEFDAVPRLVANAARVFCVAVILMHLREYTMPAPEDYDWAAHVEPIRRGVPANIPTLPEGWTLEYLGRPSPR